MKRTAFHSIHQQLGAKLVEFGGFEMPVMYTSIIEEHMSVRTSAGLFDVSHMGEFEIRGRDAAALVQRVTINDVTKLSVGKVQYSAMCYPDGGIVDDVLVYHQGDHFMLVVNASNRQKDLDWIRSQSAGLDAEVIDMSDHLSLLALQGPNSLSILQRLTATDLTVLSYYTSTRGEVAGIDMIISRTGYTGELGFELYFDSSMSTAELVWQAITEASATYSLQPVGLGARDTLRLEVGFCLYGNDIDSTTNPLEAGLGWITKLDKGDFIGRDALVKTKAEGLKRKLVGFVIDEEKAFPRHGYDICSNGALAGKVTSGTVSPVLARGIGMGYVATPSSRVGESIGIMIRNKEVRATVVKVPFITK